VIARHRVASTFRLTWPRRAVPKRIPLPALVLSALSAALICGPSPAMATAVLSSDLADFAVLAGTAGVTDVPPSAIYGDLGSTSLANGGGYTYFDTGTLQANTPLAAMAQLNLGTAISVLNGMGPTISVGANLGGLTLGPGIYTGVSLLSGGTLTLQGNGDPDDVWVFLTGGLTVATGETVAMTDVGPDASLYWVDSSSVTLGVDSTFLGNVLATTSIFADDGATDYCGRLLAGTAVTLDDNTVGDDCSAAGLAANLAGTNGLSGSNGGTGGGGVISAPEPSTLALFGGGLLGFLGLAARRRRIQLM
jgi:Ice-binding-like/PEP-CTERM motif